MNRAEVEIGKKSYLPNGAEVFARSVNTLDIDPNPSRAALAESSHIALNENNVIKASIKNSDEGETQVIEYDPIQFAAHPGDGDGHDRSVSEAMGSDYDSNARIANTILVRKNRSVTYLAGYLERHRSITGEEAKRVLKKSNEGNEVEIFLKNPDGHINTKKVNGVKENVIFVNFDNQKAV